MSSPRAPFARAVTATGMRSRARPETDGRKARPSASVTASATASPLAPTMLTLAPDTGFPPESEQTNTSRPPAATSLTMSPRSVASTKREASATFLSPSMPVSSM